MNFTCSMIEQIRTRQGLRGFNIKSAKKETAINVQNYTKYIAAVNKCLFFVAFLYFLEV